MSYSEARSNHRVELIIFDCDGVLIDSEMIAATALSAALAEDGVHLQPMELAHRFVGISDKDTLAALKAEHAEMSPRCEDRYRELVLTKLDAELVAIEGIHDVLEAIEASGIQCCVASSSSPDRLHHTLGKAGLLPYFGEKIFSSSQVSRGKPAPDLFLFAAAQCEVAPDHCVVIEDSPAGIAAAVSAGMTVAGFSGATHCGPDRASQLQRLGANHVFNRWNKDEFRNWLNGFDGTPIPTSWHASRVDTLSFASVDGLMLDGLYFCSRVYAMFNALSMQPDFSTRLRRRPTKFEKRLIEELVPLAWYVQLNYTRGVNISLCWSSGSQPGEATIRRSGLAVQWGELRAEGMLEVTQAVHKQDYLVRELLDTQGYSFSPDGISVEGKAHQGNRTVSSEAYSYGHNEAAMKQAVIVLDAIKAKVAKPYPDNTTLIVQITLTGLFMPDEWTELVRGVRDNLPEHQFDEIWLLDDCNRYYSRIPSLP